jgi:chromosome segregation ATPase
MIAKAEAADLAIGRANALQRQLDDTLQKIAWLERDLDVARASATAAESENAALADDRIRDAEDRARDAEIQLREAQMRAQQAESQGRDIEQRAREIEARAKDIEQRAKEAAERIVDSERRGRDLETKLSDALRRAELAEEQLDELHSTQERAQADPGVITDLQRELADAKARIDELELEVERADNVRSFAANTEREIAALERELRDTKAKLAQITLERDRFESQLRDMREDSETVSRGQMRAESESGGGDLSRYTAIVARAAELEQKIVKMEKEEERMRRQLADAEARLAAQHRAHEDEPTSTGYHLPLKFAEQLSVLEESIDSLRANMRAASDETAMMDQTEPVMAITDAVSQAAEHVERARDALRVLNTLVESSD